MVFLKSVLAYAALISAAAVPTAPSVSFAGEKGRFSVNLKYNEDFQRNASEPSVVARGYGSGTAVAYNCKAHPDAEYYAELLDRVSIAGASVDSQGIEYATDVYALRDGGGILGAPISGIVGFGFDSNNRASPQQKTLFSNLKPHLDEPVFTVDLRHKTDGTFGFGFVDHSKYTGALTYTAVDSSRGFWAITATGYQIGDDNFVPFKFSGIVDTGGSMFRVPTAAYRAWKRKVPAAITRKTVLPDFSFGIGDAVITVPGSHLIQITADGTYSFSITDAGNGPVLFGSPAMTGAYVVFEDGDDGPRMGWAKSA
ncbi:hypothetical protein LLEC1_02321 [Akanthomyces lecanii]|uniref:Peptidase A1 domain-containing protein n=1 Tax=Cordyceps confragosa TaxID=2714763 RepID=A0A179IJV8_CORDF|nr:hypothetical protein LLEC1_02321 [Akanthomyces lecanii]